MVFRISYAGIVMVLFMVCSVYGSESSSESFGFDIHHRLSDGVKLMLNNGGGQLPEMETVDLYNAMVSRDRFFHGRKLALTGDKVDHLTPLTFIHGNETFRISSLGFLYYANVSIGTPASWYLVALDTGSGLFWLPCDCTPNCVQSMELTPTEELVFNIYSLSTSSTGKKLGCSRSESECPYSINYLSANTSSSGYLVKDLLHLTTDADPSIPIDAKIAFGCGVTQTGAFLDGGAPNGLLGLSMDQLSVPSLLALQNLTTNAFSMCFSKKGIGRISFGESASNYQDQTPFIPSQIDAYNVTITQVAVGVNVSAESFSAIFDTGTSFTFLNGRPFALVSEKFDSQVQDKRTKTDSSIPFQYCYEINSSMENNDLRVPAINLTMEGGHQFIVQDPIILIRFEDGSSMYCLAVIRNGDTNVEKDVMNVNDINIIGENFMTGYRIIFDREQMVLGWKLSDCNEAPSPGVVNPQTDNSAAATPPAYTGTRSSNALSVTSSHKFLLIVTALLVQILSLYL